MCQKLSPLFFIRFMLLSYVVHYSSSDLCCCHKLSIILHQIYVVVIRCPLFFIRFMLLSYVVCYSSSDLCCCHMLSIILHQIYVVVICCPLFFIRFMLLSYLHLWDMVGDIYTHFVLVIN